MFSISGKLIVKNETQKITDSFRKREFVISDESSQYPQEIAFQLVQDKCDLLDPFEVGDEVKINFNIRGRRWENPQNKEVKFFNSLDAWRLEKVGQSNMVNDLPPIPTSEPANIGADDSDDLPF